MCSESIDPKHFKKFHDEIFKITGCSKVDFELFIEFLSDKGGLLIRTDSEKSVF
ncbi:hypothetical protein EV06_1377 [Prochlorococcus sp. MIT 0602]|nr:hypothetical protein EV06_1377 [Prochlorococcus sp. MIT 0602]KGG17784.1 hypothetical protein EV07_1225 [Prochlorococcus sp. MIT 0603]